jgi:hypothetical protein
VEEPASHSAATTSSEGSETAGAAHLRGHALGSTPGSQASDPLLPGNAGQGVSLGQQEQGWKPWSGMSGMGGLAGTQASTSASTQEQGSVSSWLKAKAAQVADPNQSAGVAPAAGSANSAALAAQAAAQLRARLQINPLGANQATVANQQQQQQQAQPTPKFAMP